MSIDVTRDRPADVRASQRYVSEEGDISEEDLTCVLLEVQRLYPPFFGGRRLVTRDSQVGGQ